jgi:hypothetical protein
MRQSVWSLLLLACLPSLSGAADYQPLAFLVGHCWKGTLPGGKKTDEHCFSSIYGGKFLRDRHTVHASGRADSFGESIYFWNSIAKRIEYLYIESDGGYSQGTVSMDDASLVFPPTDYVEDGKTQTYRSRWQRSGETEYEVVTEFRGTDGWVPGFKVHMVRQ